MTRRQFRDLLLIYALYWLIALAYGVYIATTLSDTAIEFATELQANEELQKQVRSFTDSFSSAQTTKTTLGAATSLLALISWIGLFKFWKPARVIFLVYLALAYFLAPITNYSYSKLLLNGPLSDYYGALFINNLNPFAVILGTAGTAFNTLIVIIIFTTFGRNLFDEPGDQNYT